MSDWDGDDYQRRIEERLAEDDTPHGEVEFVQRYAPRDVLDAGCGTGRVAIELRRRGVEVIGVDASASMLATARALDPGLDWVQADLGELDLGRRFHVVLMAGNVPLFAADTGALVAGCSRHLAHDGVLVAGFGLDRDYDLATYDHQCATAGLEVAERYATWERDAFQDDSTYAVSVHRFSSPPAAT